MRAPILVSLLSPLFTLAQPVLQYANVDLIGNSYPVHVVTDPGTSDPNTDGTNVTWDFSSATLLENVGTVSFVQPSATPFAGDFPASNLAQAVTLGSETFYAYFVLSSTKLDMLAEDVGTPDETVYSDPKTPLIFPFAYPDYFIDYYTENGTEYSVSRACMGYGTLILPTGTYTNVVKVASTSGAIDFFSSDPVMQLVNIDPDGEVLVFGDAISGLADGGGIPALRAYPNPVSEQMEVQGLRSAGSWTLTDVGGRIQRQGNYTSGTLRLDLADLATGCYVLHLQGPQGSSMVKLAKQ